MTNGYNFYIKDGSDVLTFPITPGELTINVGSNNTVVTLIDEGDVNILKSPSLIEVSFDARFPMRKYPYSREVADFETYFNKFKELKEDKKSFRFIIARTTPGGDRTWDTNLLMALENFDLKESHEEGDDVIITLKLKQYKNYGVKTIKIPEKEKPKEEKPKEEAAPPESTSTAETPRDTDNKTKSTRYYTVKSGDCLWNISKKFYGNATKWRKIYNANKNTIESAAKKHGRADSQNGHWIYPSTKLIIPAL